MQKLTDDFKSDGDDRWEKGGGGGGRVFEFEQWGSCVLQAVAGSDGYDDVFALGFCLYWVVFTK